VIFWGKGEITLSAVKGGGEERKEKKKKKPEMAVSQKRKKKERKNKKKERERAAGASIIRALQAGVLVSVVNPGRICFLFLFVFSFFPTARRVETDGRK
jgi:hypothetical protein